MVYAYCMDAGIASVYAVICNESVVCLLTGYVVICPDRGVLTECMLVISIRTHLYIKRYVY